MSSAAAISLSQMQQAFRPKQAEGLDATFNFDLAGDGGGQWQMRIADGACALGGGLAPEADVTIHSSAEDWVAMLTGELDDTTAYMSGRLRIDGDMDLAERLSDFFAK